MDIAIEPEPLLQQPAPLRARIKYVAEVVAG
jgi:hypothetical protein